MLIARILIVSVACTSFVAKAQVLYLGMDADGKVTLLKEPPPDYEATTAAPRLQAPKSSAVPIQNKSAVRSHSSAPNRAPAASALGELVLYTAEWCPYCRGARQYFKAQGIAFREINIESPEGKFAFAQAGGGRGKGIPLLVDGDRKAWGFSASYYESFLKRRGVN